MVRLKGSRSKNEDSFSKPLQRTAAQDAVILTELKKQGVNPLEIPMNKSGKSGVKAAVRSALEGNKLFVGETVFDKAWVRLTKAGDIVIKKQE